MRTRQVSGSSATFRSGFDLNPTRQWSNDVTDLSPGADAERLSGMRHNDLHAAKDVLAPSCAFLRLPARVLWATVHGELFANPGGAATAATPHQMFARSSSPPILLVTHDGAAAPFLPSAWLRVLTLAATDVQDRNPLLPQCAGSHPEGIYGSWFKEPHDQLHDLHNFTTCAIVGGGKSDNEWGADIDTNSAVFRFNDAPSRGFESLVRAPQFVREYRRACPCDSCLANASPLWRSCVPDRWVARLRCAYKTVSTAATRRKASGVSTIPSLPRSDVAGSLVCHAQLS